MKPKAIVFISARSGSKRLPNKNIRPFGGDPFLVYTVRTAIDSSVFDAVICVSDSELYADVARHYGAEVPFLRSADISGDKSPDIEWVIWVLSSLKQQGREYEVFSILRPTNPFRLRETTRRAWELFAKIPALIHYARSTLAQQSVRCLTRDLRPGRQPRDRLVTSSARIGQYRRRSHHSFC